MSRIWNLNPLVNAIVEACAPEAEQNSFTEKKQIIISRALSGLPFLVKGNHQFGTTFFPWIFAQKNWKV